MLIGEDCSVTLQFGTVAVGVITWLGSAASINGIARKVSLDDSIETTNTKALGNARKVFRGHSGSTRVEVESLVAYTGFAFLQTRATPIGLACRVIVKELSSLSSPSTFVGIVEHWKGDINETEATIESLSVLCDIDAA